MKFANTRRSSSQRGMTLIEAIVAMLIFTVVFLAALGLYQSANRAYLATDAATIQQQNSRFAMDRMVETLRDAGANYSPMGATNLADEQIEGAWESALFVRGDFDTGRENTLVPGNTINLENSTHQIVTTGNDEIVGYVLRKPGANDETLTMAFDLTTTGGRNAINASGTISGEEPVEIPVAVTDLSDQTDPPYQLTKVTFNNAGVPQYEVIADDVFRLSFTYLDAAGATMIEAGTNDGGANTQRTERARVRRIGVSLTMMSSRPDMGYSDPNVYDPVEPAATKNRRKFTLTEEILAVNLGLRGRRHEAVPAIVIDPPPSVTVCTGHCRNFLISWLPSPTAGVEDYQINVTAPASGSAPAISFTETAGIGLFEYRYEQPDDVARVFTFKVASVANGAIGSYSLPVTATMSHDAANSIPRVPMNVTGRGQAAPALALALSWDQVTTNVNALAGNTCTTVGTGAGSSPAPTGWTTEAVDLARYEVYRVRATGSNNGDFVPAAANRVDATAPNVTPEANNFIDRTAAPCSQYFYRVKSFDLCNLSVSGNGSAAMAAATSFPLTDTSIEPAVPTAPAPLAPATMAGTNYNITLGWSPVTTTSTGEPAAVAHYKLHRERSLTGPGGWTTDTTFDIYEATQYTDTPPRIVGTATAIYRYAVEAVYDCGAGGGDRFSGLSGWYELLCVPPGGHSLTIATPAAGSALSRPGEASITPRVNATGIWTALTMTITSPLGAVVYTDTRGAATGSPLGWTLNNWNVSDTTTLPDGTYTISVTGTPSVGCNMTTTQTVQLETGTCGLQLSPGSVTLLPDNNGANRFKQFSFRVQNTCDVGSMTINGLQIDWNGGATGSVIDSIQYNGNTVATADTPDNTMVGITNTTINAGTTSQIFTVNYTGIMTGATWNSILARLNTTPAQTDEILTSILAP